METHFASGDIFLLVMMIMMMMMITVELAVIVIVVVSRCQGKHWSEFARRSGLILRFLQVNTPGRGTLELWKEVCIELCDPYLFIELIAEICE